MTTLLVRTHGRWEYLRRSLASIDLGLFDRKILSCDGCWPPFTMLGWTVASSSERKGLSANIAQAWSLLEHGEWVFDTEDDMLIHDLPLPAMRAVLDATPNLAQMVLERQPVNPAEHRNGGLLGADNIPTWTDVTDGAGTFWREQSHLFSFNPHLRRHDRTLFPHGWGGTETEATARLRPGGWVFGFWGAQGDAPRCEHIGEEQGMGSAGWAA